MILGEGNRFYFSKMSAKLLIIQHASPEPSRDHQEIKSMFPPLEAGCTFDTVSTGRVS